MPTENRSSNTEMVSDAEMTECQFHNNCGGWCETRRELEHNLCEHCLEAHDEEMASPAQQHQGEPVAWIYSRPEGQVNPVVLLKRASESDRGSWDETPLYTHADPDEVERLRGQINEWAGKWEKAISAGAVMEGERNTLRSKLAEREALLRDLGLEPDDVSDMYSGVAKDAERYRLLRERMCVDDFPPPHPDWSTPSELESKRIDELCDIALSASAEPSADLCAEGAHEFVPFRSECVKCGEPYSTDPSAPVERDELRIYLEAMCKLWPSDLSDDGSGRMRFKPEVVAVVKNARAALKRKPS